MRLVIVTDNGVPVESPIELGRLVQHTSGFTGVLSSVAIHSSGSIRAQVQPAAVEEGTKLPTAEWFDLETIKQI
jgi:hypothetical protein